MTEEKPPFWTTRRRVIACVLLSPVSFITFRVTKKLYRKLTGTETMIVQYFNIKSLNDKSTAAIRKSLKTCRADAILLGINQKGGDNSSLVQAEIVGKLF